MSAFNGFIITNFISGNWKYTTILFIFSSLIRVGVSHRVRKFQKLYNYTYDDLKTHLTKMK